MAPSAEGNESASTWEAFGAYLRTQRKLAQLSLRQLAAITQISNPYLSQIERGLHQPSITILKSLADALNLSTSDVLAQAADLVSSQESMTTTQGAIRNDPLLSDAHKSALLTIYASMVDAPAGEPDSRPPDGTP